MKKPIICRACGTLGHYKYQCYSTPKKKIKVKRMVIKRKPVVQKTDIRWVATKRKWFKANPPINGYYQCIYCLKIITKDDELNDFGVSLMTLDHKIPKSNMNGIKLKYDIGNLVPSCWECNSKKGSMSYDNYIKKYAKHLL
jgi:5-methylcytosine-specific restriction endonuclease McrA